MTDEQSQQHSGPSLGLMLVLLFSAILLAAGIAFWMIYPFFHRQPH